MASQDRDRDNIFHERISILRDQGYRGFTVTSVKKEWDGVLVTARNNDGRTLSGAGDTNEEAYENLIDAIDRALEIT